MALCRFYESITPPSLSFSFFSDRSRLKSGFDKKNQIEALEMHVALQPAREPAILILYVLEEL